MERQDEDLSTERLFARFWKSILSPFKKMNKRFRSFEVQMENLHKSCNSSGDMSSFAGDFGAVIQKKLMPLDQALREEMEETRVAVNDQTSQIHKVSQAVANAAYVSEQVLEEIGNQFTALRAILVEHFGEAKSLIRQYCGKGASYTPVSHPAPPVAPYPTAAPRKAPQYRPTLPTQQPNRRGSGVDCSDIVNNGTASGIYKLLDQVDLDDAGQNYYNRYCDMDTDGGGWTVIQRRGHYGPPYENFTRDWKEYKYGFGNMEYEFWWSNDFTSRLSSEQEYNIRFDLWDFDGNYAYAEYLTFGLTGEDDNYRLRVSGYRGNASDSFSAHNGYLFSTFDRDNDEAPECCPCAPAYGGGWWFYSCFESNLNGEYHTDPKENDYYRGIIWELWLGDYSLKATEIKIRPSSFRMSEEDDAFPTPYPGPPEGELPLRVRPQ
ncbi:unnamed protein product [Meganyctiphanes norvegica]|uniref:Fibrinogen C-terminal domain-containing protein n=1 Tax=Meganyctiphanes norvegica TaxID=48144 RepID=A0AAV2PQZ7_MEGNR